MKESRPSQSAGVQCGAVQFEWKSAMAHPSPEVIKGI